MGSPNDGSEHERRPKPPGRTYYRRSSWPIVRVPSEVFFVSRYQEVGGTCFEEGRRSFYITDGGQRRSVPNLPKIFSIPTTAGGPELQDRFGVRGHSARL